MLNPEFLKQLSHTLSIELTQPETLKTKQLMKPDNMIKNPEKTIEEKRIAVVEKSVYIEGVRVIQKQERIGYFFTLIVSLVLVILLFIVLRVV